MSHLVKNPFPGPQPYRASDRRRFFGREDLSYQLQGRVLANRCVTVHGPSGAGKSSLMQASVIPSLVDAQRISVVLVDRWPEGEEPIRWLAREVYAGFCLGALPEDLSAEDALLMAAKRVARRSPRIMLLYLDQIEQLLAASRSADVAEAFFGSLNRLLDLPLRALRVVLSLREDDLGAFRDCARDHHRLLDYGFRVGPLSVGELTDAACKAAAAGEPPQTWDREQVRALLLQTRVPGQAATDRAEVQATYAQIVCRELFQQRASGDGASGDVEAEPILRAYLDTTLDALGPLKGSAHHLLEDHLIAEDGSRTLRTEKELLQAIPEEQLSPILEALESAAIIHAEDHQSSRYFEIGHDWLAKKVLDQRRQREREEVQRRELQRQREASEVRLAEERKLQRRRLAVVAAASVVLVTGGSALGFWSWQQKRTAEERSVRAEVEVHEAKSKLAEARLAAELAQSEAARAREGAEAALSVERHAAERVRIEGERMQMAAKQALKEAEQKQKVAEQKQIEAARARIDAERAQMEAKEARLAAEVERRRVREMEQALRACQSALQADPNRPRPRPDPDRPAP